ncbi:hypothetical protein BVRB_1g002780 [Beta vulgaris subsp. vulgaris]|nr:hypothetical protein BVRB_1g002780 [Beta vulgaris subsp. vulgaris]
MPVKVIFKNLVQSFFINKNLNLHKILILIWIFIYVLYPGNQRIVTQRGAFHLISSSFNINLKQESK